MRVAGSLVVIALAMTTVASGQTSPAASKAPEACSLLMKEDAAAALGETVQGPKATNSPNGPSACDTPRAGPSQSALERDPARCRQRRRVQNDVREEEQGRPHRTGRYDVPGTNDKHGELQVLKGLTFFSIELSKNGDPTEAIKAVAQKVYGRLK